MDRVFKSRRFAALLFTLALLGAGGVQAQVPENCPHVCNQRYALCIAASCDASGSCGDCNTSDGSCGYCYVFEGESCSYNKPCAELRPSGETVYSTYSEVLSAQFGFKVMTCAGATAAADCMDGKCTLTGRTVKLTDENGQVHMVATAICQCQVTKNSGSTLGGDCNTQNCSAIWSTAAGVLDSVPHCSGY